MTKILRKRLRILRRAILDIPMQHGELITGGNAGLYFTDDDEILKRMKCITEKYGCGLWIRYVKDNTESAYARFIIKAKTIRLYIREEQRGRIHKKFPITGDMRWVCITFCHELGHLLQDQYFNNQQVERSLYDYFEKELLAHRMSYHLYRRYFCDDDRMMLHPSNSVFIW